MSHFLYYLFSIGVILSAVFVIISKNLIYAVISLIFSFISVSGLFILLNVKLLAFFLLLVYVGAIMVLFVFVLMILIINEFDRQKKWGVYLLVIYFLVFLFNLFIYKVDNLDFLSIKSFVGGDLLICSLSFYKEFGVGFLIGGLILLLAMIGVFGFVGDISWSSKLDIKRRR